MKIRQGFVSNSSTSSFVLIGFEVKKSFSDRKVLETVGVDWEISDDYISEDIYALEDELGIRYMNSEDDGAPRGKKVIGVVIADMASDGGDQSDVVPFDDVLNKVKELQAKFGAKDKDIKIYSGTRAC